MLGKGVLPRAGEYTSDVLLNGLAAFLAEARPAGIDADAIAARAKSMLAHKAAAMAAVGDMPARPPNFCTGCPERPVFSAIKLVQRELGPTHISADIGCHAFATFAPFSLGNSILGYGMSLASAAAVAPNMDRRPIAVMGDGGFWHNGLITGVASNLFNKGDGVLIVMKNGYTSATGQQYLPSSAANRLGAPTGMTIEQTLRSLGVKWLRTVHTYSVAKMAKTLKEAMRTAERGLKVIIADGECQLARQRRVRAEDAEKLKRGERVVRVPLRRRRRDLHRRPFLHPAVRLPVADREAQSRSAAQRPGGDRDRELRRLRPVRRGRARRGAVPVVLPRRGHPQSELVGSRAPPRARRGVIGAVRHPPRRGARMSAPQARPITMLIAALGGEGGGVLTDWIVGAAAQLGLSGAVDLDPRRRPAHRRHHLLHRDRAGAGARAGGATPVLALAPGVGDVDIVVASELMEAGRAVAAGFVTPDRTLLIASTARSYLVVEKMAMGDGRYDPRAPDQGDRDACAKRTSCSTWTRWRKQSGAMINAVMLGLIAGCGRLPIPVEAFEARDPRGRQGRRRQSARLPRRSRRRGEGKCSRAPTSSRRQAIARPRTPLAGLEREIVQLPAAARDIVRRRRAPARRLSGRSPMRGSISTGWRRSAPPMRAPEPAAACCARPRGISRCACRTRT